MPYYTTEDVSFSLLICQTFTQQPTDAIITLNQEDVLEFVILSAVDSMSYTPRKLVFSNYFVFQSLGLKIAFSRSDCFLVSWLTDWSGHCGLVHTEVKIAQKNGATLGNKGNCKLQRSAAVIATQGINFVALRRRGFCCPRRQWLECYDCHAT